MELGTEKMEEIAIIGKELNRFSFAPSTIEKLMGEKFWFRENN
jgi:hypothetical protein